MMRASRESGVPPPSRRRAPAVPARPADSLSGGVAADDDDTGPGLRAKREVADEGLPARSRIVSPYEAASIAAWRSVYAHPLAQTVRVAASIREASGERQTRTHTTHTSPFDQRTTSCV